MTTSSRAIPAVLRVVAREDVVIAHQALRAVAPSAWR